MISQGNTEEFADMLFGGRRASAQRLNKLFSEPGFDQDWWAATKNPGKQAYERYLALLPQLAATETADLRELVTWHEQATVVDPHLGALLTVQVNLVRGTLLEQHSRTGEVAAALTELSEGRAVGAYVLTEVGHGSDLNNLETTATYDPSDGGGFVLHTPTDTAVKFMPTTAPPPVEGVSRFGIVFAGLILDGTHRGNYPFLVRLVDADGQALPGITIRPLPEKPGLGMDNSLTRFDHVRLSRECLLSHTGTRIDDNGELISPIPADNQAWRAISRVRVGRLCIAAMSAAVSRAALSIAVSHATQRDIASMVGGRIPLSALPAHRDLLLDAVADTYVATAAVEVAIDAFVRAADEHDDEQGPKLTDLVSLTKHFATTTALRVCNEVRDRLGAQGVFAHNKIVEFRALRDAAATAEGDSYVIALQAAYRRLPRREESAPRQPENLAPCDVDTPGAWLDWLDARALHLQHRTAEKYAGVSGDRQTRWDGVYDLALAAAEAHIAHRSARALADRAAQLPEGPREVIEKLLVLFAIRQCQANGADLLPGGPFPVTPEPLSDMRRRVQESLAPHLNELVAAFELDSGLLRTAFDADGYVAQCASALAESVVDSAA
ncbi:acyl-CoA dehydrogenase family protein [Nocardia arizonensis]|uniref:acyl-CoA dehydrogenase family protein n=1 Tax=Nocardia arizonensis TaxID=1141647 RepID=UPI0006CF3AEF|nr:acyl-CoA dehydrogenase family protein [Nocardia arizonensis]